jgi:hypothetical protein
VSLPLVEVQRQVSLSCLVVTGLSDSGIWYEENVLVSLLQSQRCECEPVSALIVCYANQANDEATVRVVLQVGSGTRVGLARLRNLAEAWATAQVPSWLPRRCHVSYHAGGVRASGLANASS